jgi:Arc/MetJ-type ribon-helix-helix transcriptional regulator
MPKASKVMVSMPEELLERIDRAVDERGTSRSAFLQEAARRELGWPDRATIDAALSRGRAVLEGAGSFEAAELIRAERDSRDARDRRR